MERISRLMWRSLRVRRYRRYLVMWHQIYFRWSHCATLCKRDNASSDDCEVRCTAICNKAFV